MADGGARNVTDARADEELARLRAWIERYRRLEKTVREARVLETSVYFPDVAEDWVLMQREDYADIMAALAEVEQLAPWDEIVERRLGEI